MIAFQRIKVISVCLLLLLLCAAAPSMSAVDINFTLEELKAEKQFMALSAEDRQIVERQFTEDMWEKQHNNIGYISGGQEKRRATIEAFNAKYPMGQQVTEPETKEMDDVEWASTVENMTTTAIVISGLILLIVLIRILVKSFNSGKLSRVRSWYSGINKKQRIIIWILSVILSAVPVLGWVFVAPWLIPGMVYLEYCRE